jgi:hypothetical protein
MKQSFFAGKPDSIGVLFSPPRIAAPAYFNRWASRAKVLVEENETEGEFVNESELESVLSPARLVLLASMSLTPSSVDRCFAAGGDRAIDPRL